MNQERRLWVWNGKVYRDDHVIASYTEYRLAHPDTDLTVEQWEIRKLRQIERLEP